MFSLVVVASLGTSIRVLILTAVVIYTPGAFRTARSLAVNVNALDFVTVARARGEGTFFIMREEILPNLVLPVLTDFGLRFVYVVLLLSGLSFLGLGIQPPVRRLGFAGAREPGRPGRRLAGGDPARAGHRLATIGVNLLIDNLPTRRARRCRAEQAPLVRLAGLRVAAAERRRQQRHRR